MSLQGTFDTLSVPELFGLLSTAGKTGALRLEAGALEASVFVTGGLCCAVEADAGTGVPGVPGVPGAIGRVESDGDLAARLVDVGFSFARLAEGSFRFSDSEQAGYDTGVTTPLEPAAAEIRSLLAQWREIEATIPSLDVRVRLAPVLHQEQIVVSAEEWGLLVALETMPSVRDLVARRREPMMQVCREIKALIDRGAVEIGADFSSEHAPSGTAAPDHEPFDQAPSDRSPERDTGAHGEPPAGATRTSHLLEPTEPFAPGSLGDDAEPSGESADFGTDAGAIAAEADVVAAGIVSRMTRGRRPLPDAFAGADADDPVMSVAVDDRVAPDRAPSGPATPERAASDSDPASDPSQDRGALLRLFSALKES